MTLVLLVIATGALAACAQTPNVSQAHVFTTTAIPSHSPEALAPAGAQQPVAPICTDVNTEETTVSLLVNPDTPKLCRVYPRGILYDNVYFQPIYNKPEDYELLANKAEQYVPVCGIWLGKDHHVVLSCLDDVNWIEVIPDHQQEIESSTYNQFQEQLQKKKRTQRNERRDLFQSIMQEELGYVPPMNAQTGKARPIEAADQAHSDEQMTVEEPTFKETEDVPASNNTPQQPISIASNDSTEMTSSKTAIPNFAEILRRMRDTPDS